MTHSNQTNGIKQGAAQVRHNRPIKKVLKFPLPKNVHKVWFQIFLPKKSDKYLIFHFSTIAQLQLNILTIGLSAAIAFTKNHSRTLFASWTSSINNQT